LALHALVGEPVAAVFLAFAPGGLAEMSLVALSLKMSVIYVTAHHVLRIMLAVGLAKLGSRMLDRLP
ncbi:MAG: AbrB family transcriptional regulator, partial [Sphingomonadales bacterium]